ncbi:cysteine--tRNA ligase [Anaerococcus porci]|uniref:cysteine--tRNA ligase n=1 Tax=Anaerococcus porci TaxID=2652269 RepID=UPI002A74D410|nr:cysteine--tRNA ligase [Anaerococcus porci]MDY3005757.1 cysteine--tRNA ligase [Anaerococcus porci]
MKIYNTFTRKKEDFKTIDENKVKMYVCGPTVYDYMHIGNARPLVVFDTMRRYLGYLGYDVKYVVNFTDVDDKIINKAIKENITTKEVSDKFIKAYMEDSKDLNIDEENTIHPKATETMDDIINFVKELIDKDAAYVSDGDVYFDISKAKNYGHLSGKNIEDLREGASNRLDDKDKAKKRNPMDFTLWKATKKQGEISWDSPWGSGRPGWHIECSAMTKKYLGETIDIHAGGEDLQFPHHENEIAQSETRSGKKFANYWMHNGMIQVDGTKMSKSLGNFFTLHDIKKEYDLMVVRFWLLSAGYRLPINFTRQIIEQAQNSLNRLNNAKFRLDDLLKITSGNLTDDEKKSLKELDLFEKEFKRVMDDDLNTPDAITVLFDIAKFANTKVDSSSSKEFVEKTRNLYLKLEDVLGIENRKKSTDLVDEDDINKLIDERNEAKREKNYQKADEIRDKLSQMGIILKDTKEGTKWELK